jgi:hypothetical protein
MIHIYNMPSKARPAPMAAIGSAVAAAMPSEPVVEAPVCAATEPVDEPVVVCEADDWSSSSSSSSSLLDEPVARGSLIMEVMDAKSRPADEKAADTLERAAGSRVERMPCREDAADEAAESIASIESLTSDVACAAMEDAADWIDGDAAEREDSRAEVSMEASEATE